MRYFVVDAFTDTVFKGNPAGVCLLDEWLEDSLMQNIAAENNLAETAFVIKRDNYYDLRWFTPEIEMDLCGHATLASAFVVTNFVDTDAAVIRFETASGTLTVARKDGMYEMDFPARKPAPIDVTPDMERAIGLPVLEAHLSRDLLLVVDYEQQVSHLDPNIEILSQIPGCFGVIVTAKGDTVDFVSRFFAPNAGVPEDPVTGSSHSTLIPFWAERLQKTKMVANQLSRRGGTIICESCGDRVKMAGKATLYLEGVINCQ